MLVTEKITINNREYIHNFSDAGYYIERDGILYEDAVDPSYIERIYKETYELIPIEDDEATIDDYKEALESLGVGFNEA